MSEVVITNQALKDWEVVLSPDFKLPPHLFLMASLASIATVEVGGDNYAYVDWNDVKKFVKKDTLETGLALLNIAGMIQLTETKIIIGKRKGLHSISYLFETLDDSPTTPVQKASVYAEPEIAPKGVVGDLTELKARLTALYEAYEQEYVSLYRSSANPDYVFGKLKAIIAKADNGKEFSNAELLNYISCLDCMKNNLKSITSHYGGKELKMAETVLKTIPTSTLIELVPYFVLDFCTSENNWTTPTVQNLLGQRHVLLGNYNKRRGHGKSTGTGFV